MKKTLSILALFSVFLLLVALPAHAQTGQISGTVTDSTTGDVLPGVNVVVSGTQRGASTDAQGQYTISNLEPGTYAVEASFIGYNSQTISGVEVSPGETTQVNIQLVPGAVQLDEVVAVGYGTQREEEVTGSVASVSSEDFIEGPARDVAALIEGQVAGLNITQSSGNPSAGSEISLRGTTTISASSSPLVLIDGVPGSLQEISPQDIESVEVLKGGAAGAIYGSRASNGVILITTKSSDRNEVRLTYNGYVTGERINNRMDFTSADELRSAKEEYGSQFPSLPINTVEDRDGSTDWRNEVLRDNPVSHTHSLALSGGSQGTSYRASLRYENLEGLMQRSYNEQTIGRLSFDHSMFENQLQFKGNLAGRLQNDYNGEPNRVWRQTLNRNPTDRVYDDEGNYVRREQNNYFNPVSLINERDGTNNLRKIRLDGTVTARPLENFELSLQGSINREVGQSEWSETFEHPSTARAGLDAPASTSSNTDGSKLLEATGTYDNSIGDHDFDVLGGYSWQENTSEYSYAYNFDFPTDQFKSDNLQLGRALADGEADLGSGSSSWKLISFFSRANYTYRDRYILTASLRYEGNSKFGADNKWGTFPSISAGWRIGQEDFIEGVPFIDQLKLRAGYGVTGIAPEDSYQSLASFQYTSNFYNDGEWVPALEPARNANPDLKWERKEEINVGLDFTAFNQRLSGQVDVYRRTTEDLLYNYNVPVPPFLFPTILANVGTMKNQGIEGSLSYDILRSDNLNWSTNVNFSTNQNELTSLSNDQFQVQDNSFLTGFIGGNLQLPSHIVEVGEPIGNFYGFKSFEVNDDGNWIIEDEDGNRIPSTERALEDRQVIGNGVPDYRLSLNSSFRAGNFDARITMGGAFGHQLVNKTRLYYANAGFGTRKWLDEAYEPKPGGNILRGKSQFVSYFVEDGDYWKIESLTIGYDVGSFIEFARRARVYVTGRNLLTITGYSGIDPELDTTGLTPGFDDIFKYPTTRAYTLGINLDF